MSAERYWAVVPAAGKGMRMGAQSPKQYLNLSGRTVIEHTLERLISHSRIAGAVVAVAQDDEHWPQIARDFGDCVATAIGGAERCHSVLAGLDGLGSAASGDDWVLVHDAARPCLRAEDIDRMLDELTGDPCGGILAVPVRDTLKRCDETSAIIGTVDRTSLWHALTPQMFRLADLRRAVEQALAAGVIVTDEAQAIELAGGVPRVVEGHMDNIKITHPDDLLLAELYMQAQGAY
jgi:2-C-methyl-D-erythritol 4-phosphate cytidylyltransferase